MTLSTVYIFITIKSLKGILYSIYYFLRAWRLPQPKGWSLQRHRTLKGAACGHSPSTPPDHILKTRYNALKRAF